MINFRYIQNKFEELESKIVHTRDRKTEDIELSAIAEIIEFNESLLSTHKTWKEVKEFTREEQLEEYVDIIFFILQLAIDYDEPLYDADFISGRNEYLASSEVNSLLTDLISALLKGNFEMLLIIMGIIAEKLKYSDEEIVKTFEGKLNKNLSRIGGEWR